MTTCKMSFLLNIGFTAFTTINLLTLFLRDREDYAFVSCCLILNIVALAVSYMHWRTNESSRRGSN